MVSDLQIRDRWSAGVLDAGYLFQGIFVKYCTSYRNIKGKKPEEAEEHSNSK